MLHHHLVITAKLGRGTFSTVVKCTDVKTGREWAVKVSRCQPQFRDAAMREIQTLIYLKYKDEGSKHSVIRVQGWFEFENHVFAIFPLFGPTLGEVIRSDRPTLRQVQAIGRSLLRSLAFLHSLRVVHTDVKPSNLLTNRWPKRLALDPAGEHLDVVLIDFGSALFESEITPGVLTTPCYRAPEIILGIKARMASDVWSAGCVLFELAMRTIFFRPESEDRSYMLAVLEELTEQRITQRMLFELAETKFRALMAQDKSRLRAGGADQTAQSTTAARKEANGSSAASSRKRRRPGTGTGAVGGGAGSGGAGADSADAGSEARRGSGGSGAGDQQPRQRRRRGSPEAAVAEVAASSPVTPPKPKPAQPKTASYRAKMRTAMSGPNPRMRRLSVTRSVDEDLYDLLTKMLSMDYVDRISAAAALSHPFFTKAI